MWLKFFKVYKFTMISGLIGIWLLRQILFGEASVFNLWKLKKTLHEQEKSNQELALKNEKLGADIQDLKQGKDAIEERARNDLGMVKDGEKLYLLDE